MLKGKTVVLGVTGSIAAYKIASLASMLVKQHCDVHVIMTKNATNFINPIAFETLTNNKCLVDTFDRNFQFHVAHVSLAQKADVMMIAPASANIIAKLAHGIADDMLSTTALACSAKKIISPAMNVHMFENPIVQDNLNILKKYDMEVVEPAVGYLACGDPGAGKMPEPEVLFEYILREIACEKDLKGENHGDCRTNTGGDRSSTLYHQSFHRKDGICDCKKGNAAWCGCNTYLRSGCIKSSSIREDGFCSYSTGYV